MSRSKRAWIGAITGRVGILLVLGMGFLLLASIKGEAVETVWPPKTMPISFWCGPPEPYITVEQYRRIAEAGFTVVMPPCEGEATIQRNRKILDTAKATGLKVILSDSRMPLALSGDPKATAALQAIVKDYRRHPALMGYFLTDEPGANSFAGLAEVVAELRKLDPDHIAYINLFPNYASNNLSANPSQLQTDTYDHYLERFLATVKPDVLSWDHYHFLTNSDRSGFFGNLDSGQRAATAGQSLTPFWQIVLSVQHGPYRALNENELRFEAMQTLVYGASGLVYFTYWLPDDPSFKWSNAIMNRDGTPGPLYEPVTKVNKEVKTLAKWLYGAQVVGTFQTGEIPADGHTDVIGLPIKAEGTANLSIGFFRGAKGYVYALVTNRDYAKATSAKIDLEIGQRVPEMLDLATNRWKPQTAPLGPNGKKTVSVELGPAGAALIRWQ